MGWSDIRRERIWLPEAWQGRRFNKCCDNLLAFNLQLKWRGKNEIESICSVRSDDFVGSGFCIRSGKGSGRSDFGNLDRRLGSEPERSESSYGRIETRGPESDG